MLVRRRSFSVKGFGALWDNVSYLMMQAVTTFATLIQLRFFSLVSSIGMLVSGFSVEGFYALRYRLIFIICVCVDETVAMVMLFKEFLVLWNNIYDYVYLLL
jgi:hypothetical protein